MGLVEKATLLREFSTNVDPSLAAQLIDEFASLERRFILRDWEPAELDGGQFVEILARILYHLDSGTLNQNKSFDDCLKFIENEQVQHLISPRQNALHMLRVLRTVYKFRSQRGAIHISANYSANQMDAKLIAECVRWLMIETIRLYSRFSREEAAKVIRELLQFDVPCVGKFDEKILVQRTDITAEEEVLILLHYAGEEGYTRKEIGAHAKCDPAGITRAVQKLESGKFRQILDVSGKFRLTDIGSRRVRSELSPKLVVQ